MSESQAKITISAEDLASAVLLKVKDEMSGVADGMKSFGDTTTGSSHALAEFAAVATGFAAGEVLGEALRGIGEGVTHLAEAFPELVEHAIAVGDQLFEMSLKTGASVENLSALRFVASQTGISFDSLGTTFFKMEQALGSTGQKADDLQQHLDLLHLNLNTLKNEKPDQAFIDIMSALEQIPNRADQAATGMAIFGRGFKDMAGLTQESIKDLIAEANRLGLVMSTDQAAAAHVAEIGWQSFEMQVEAVGNAIGGSVLPVLITLEQLAGESPGAGV